MHCLMSGFPRRDPDLGGYRPLPPGVIPRPIERPDYRTNDPFGYNDLGEEVLRSNDRKRSGPEARPRQSSEQVRQRLRYEYRVCMAKDDWGWLPDRRYPVTCYGISHLRTG